MKNANDLIDNWKNGRMMDLVNIQFSGSLSDVPDYYVIVSEMPVMETVNTKVSQPDKGTFDEDVFIERKRDQVKKELNCFVRIGSVRAGNQFLGGPIWDNDLSNAMPFPSLELAQEFNAKVINLGDTKVITVKELLEVINSLKNQK